MSEQELKPLQNSSQSFFGLLFDPNPAPQVNEFFQELLATVKEGGGKTVGPEGEFHEEVDPSQGSHHDVLDIELFIKIPKTLFDSPSARIGSDHSSGFLLRGDRLVG